MMRNFALAALGAATVAFASVPAAAKPYIDYTPQKGYWDINAISVDPNHVDDYLTGVSKSLVPVFETLKRRGLIDQYKFMSRIGYVKGSPNVLIMTHSPTSANLDPDQKRDQAIEKEMLAQFSKQAGDAAVAGYEKYRTFIDNAQWTVVQIKK